MRRKRPSGEHSRIVTRRFAAAYSPQHPHILEQRARGRDFKLHTTLTMTQHVALGCVSTCNDAALRCGLSIRYHSESAHLLLSPGEAPLHVLVTVYAVAAPVC